jgi:hypothetical protein
VNNKLFVAMIGVVIIGGFTLVVIQQRPDEVRPGVAVADQGRKHVDQNAKTYNGNTPPTSGDHAEPVQWGVYNKELPDINTIHNLEHGGIYITYQPSLPSDQIEKIKSLFGAPYSRQGFTPSKALLAPRAANSAPIVLSSWNRELTLKQFDEQAMYDYYIANIGKSPEPGAR